MTGPLISRKRGSISGTNNRPRTFNLGPVMKSKQLLLSLTCAAVIAACAAPAPAPTPAPPAMATLLQQADSAIKAGQNDAAVATLKVAAQTYPANKTPWLRIAQISFDCHDYGEAITHAKKVLELDGADVVAQSLLAVSGLRVSSKALADLTMSNKLMSGDVRAEAQNLAFILRTSIGGDIIPASTRHDSTKPRAGKAVAATPVKTAAQGLMEILDQPNDLGKK